MASRLDVTHAYYSSSPHLTSEFTVYQTRWEVALKGWALRNLAVCQHLLGHKSIGSTAHYLGVDQRKALDLAKRIKF